VDDTEEIFSRGSSGEQALSESVALSGEMENRFRIVIIKEEQLPEKNMLRERGGPRNGQGELHIEPVPDQGSLSSAEAVPDASVEKNLPQQRELLFFEDFFNGFFCSLSGNKGQGLEQLDNLFFEEEDTSALLQKTAAVLQKGLRIIPEKTVRVAFQLILRAEKNIAKILKTERWRLFEFLALLFGEGDREEPVLRQKQGGADGGEENCINVYCISETGSAAAQGREQRLKMKYDIRDNCVFPGIFSMIPLQREQSSTDGAGYSVAAAPCIMGAQDRHGADSVKIF